MSNSTEETKMGKLISKLLRQYTQTFHETLPLAWMDMSDEDMVSLLTDCIAKKKPYRLNLPKGSIL